MGEGEGEGEGLSGGWWCAVPGPLSTAIGRLRDWRGCNGVMVQGCHISCTSPAAGV